jgi:CubicO group peptidase (beta-lactamase class C family)
MKLSRLKTAMLLAGMSLCIAGGAYAQSRTNAEPERTTTAAPQRVSPNQPVRATIAQSNKPTRAVSGTVKGLSVSDERLLAHKMKPANLNGAVSDEGADEAVNAAAIQRLTVQAQRNLNSSAAGQIRGEIAAMKPDKDPGATGAVAELATVVPFNPGAATDLAAPPSPYLDVSAFGEAFHAAVKDNVAGYSLRVGKNGKTIYTLQWNWAQTPTDSSLGWNPSRRMHVASISKLITAMAMTKLLDDKGISYDAKIVDYLPTYWTKGPNINQITFRQLMTHRSGFTTGGSSSDYQFMKGQVAAGVTAGNLGDYDYENMNFGLCRILISVINGNISKDTMFAANLNDQLWDAWTIASYENYVQANVFAPAGVTGASHQKPASPARAYSWPVSGAGWNSGDLASMSGGAGWHMSINEILAVMHTFRRTSKIMPMAKAQGMLDASFGIDNITQTPAGKLYDKNGRWRDGSQRTEQGVAFFLPDGMDVVVFTNSPIGPNAASLRGLVASTITANIVTP